MFSASPWMVSGVSHPDPSPNVSSWTETVDYIPWEEKSINKVLWVSAICLAIEWLDRMLTGRREDPRLALSITARRHGDQGSESDCTSLRRIRATALSPSY